MEVRAPIEKVHLTVLEMGTTLTNTKVRNGQSKDHWSRSAHCGAFRLGRQRRSRRRAEQVPSLFLII